MSGFDNDCVYANNIDLSGAGNGQGGNPTLLTDGQMLIASTALNAGNTHVNVGKIIAGSTGTVVVGYTSPNITLDVVGGGTSVVEHLTADSGGQLNPSASNFNLNGSGSLTTVGLGSNITFNLTGLTNHSVLVGAGTTTITKVGPTATAGQVLQSAGAAADPAFSTATYPLTTIVSQILYSSSTNTVTGLATTNRASLTTNSTGVPAWIALTDGQIVVGSTAGSPAAASITSTGGTVTVTGGSNTINLEVASGGFTWNNVSGTSATMAKENGYQTNNVGLVTLTMPTVASSTFGDTIKIAGFGAGGWLIQCVATQLIHFGSVATAAAGSIASTNRYDAIELVCSSTTTEWICRYAIGNLTVT